jgi:hypothetical protein
VIAALVLALAGVRVYDGGSVVTLDTVSACMPMSELRQATERLQDRVLLLQEVQLDSARHQADSSALQHCQAGNGYRAQASDSLRVAYTAADHARRACVDSAVVIAKQGEHAYRNGILVGGGVGVIAAVLAFVAGFLLS